MRLAEVEIHIASMSELRDIVGAMRSLASMRVQEAHRTLPGIRRYAETMAAAVGSALQLLPERGSSGPEVVGRRALILCTAEHGFVGAFNARVLDAAESAFDRRDPAFVVGSRGGALARERGWTRVSARPMATRPQGAPEIVRPLTAELYRAIAHGQIGRVDVMFARHPSGGTATIEKRQLLPIDPASFAASGRGPPPLHNLAPEPLFESLVADYVFARLTEAVVESLASENAARFAAMGSAYDNVSKKLDELRLDARLARQSEITMELLDLVTGAEALQNAPESFAARGSPSHASK
jgi:F-type H+-transporting ATPase subunit gamma